MKDTEEKIIRQALQYFIENDYQGASLNSIAKAIGITKGGIYHYFNSKEDLFKECILYFFDVMSDLLEEMIDGEIEMGVEDFLAGFFRLDEMLALIAKRLEIDLLKDYLNYVYLIFLGMKKFPELKLKMSEVYAGTKINMQLQLENYQRNGLIRESLNCKNFAIHVLALSEGLMQVASIDSHIDFKEEGLGIVESLLRIIG